MKEAGRNLWDLRTPMRDGVELSTDLYLPEGGVYGGPYPVVLLRTADNNQHPAHTKPAKHLADKGFAVALQDVRGRHDSQGTFRPFLHEGRDGYDTIEWLASQEWCTGRVGTMGAGYSAFAQWAAAREHPPHLTTMVSTSPMGGWTPGYVPLPMVQWLHAMSARVWQEGRQVDWERVMHHLPIGSMGEAIGCSIPSWREWLDPTHLAALWDEVRIADVSGLDLPVLHLTGWFDDAKDHAISLYDGMRAQSQNQALVVGPWDRTGCLTGRRFLGGVDFGEQAVVDIEDLHTRWFDRGLREGSSEKVTSRLFSTGENAWRDGDLATATDIRTYHLRAGGGLSAEAPGAEPPDAFRYDPAAPVVIGTDLRFFPSPPDTWVEPALDHTFVDRRPDVLAYTSEPLPEAIAVSGAATVTLQVGTDCAGTDWFAELSDVQPAGPALSLTHGVVRGHGNGEVTVDLGSVSHVFREGHCIRLSVTSSRFPFYARSLNTDEPIADATEARVATNTVHHDPGRVSRLVLPVVQP